MPIDGLFPKLIDAGFAVSAFAADRTEIAAPVVLLRFGKYWHYLLSISVAHTLRMGAKTGAGSEEILNIIDELDDITKDEALK